ncbi:PR domain zinc finger protein 5-like [Chelonus insularis]|uniref:PR domain zinc finger protein 5-like n=1 Tax=Chelonus insularis TaxID=460826 RepID=UPI00158B70EE|nr:PR domain zinc finger protein 5-like [Chelonus insularis]
MRVKNYPKRRIQRNFSTKCENISNCNVQWNIPMNVGQLQENNTCNAYTNHAYVYEALNLEMKKASISVEEFNNSELSEALDLSIKNIPVSTPNEFLSSSDPKKEFKDLYLYKILTNQQLLDDLKKNVNANENESDDNSLSCQYCKRQFTSEQELMEHSNVTKNIITNKVSCCACQKTFSQKRYLKYHQRCHSDRNKFTCDICRKKYSRLDNLTRHNIFHTNPNKFRCSFCDRTFARKDLLNKHIKSHENKNRYRCEICQKSFKGPITLKNHNEIFHVNE